MKVTIRPVIIGALGTISKELEKRLGELVTCENIETK